MSNKISIWTTKGTELIKLDEILYCEAKGRYTNLKLVDDREFLLTRVLKEVEGALPKSMFFRTHRSFLINLYHLKSYNIRHQLPLTLCNDVKIPLAKRRIKLFKQQVRNLAPSI